MDEVILEMFVDQKVNAKRDDIDRETLAAHIRCPVHRAHPWTRESFLYVLAGILGVVGVASMVAGQVPSLVGG